MLEEVGEEGWEKMEEEEGHGEGEGIRGMELGVRTRVRVGLGEARVWCAGSTGSGLPAELMSV